MGVRGKVTEREKKRKSLPKRREGKGKEKYQRFGVKCMSGREQVKRLVRGRVSVFSNQHEQVKVRSTFVNQHANKGENA